jgi:hypothetical protein
MALVAAWVFGLGFELHGELHTPTPEENSGQGSSKVVPEKPEKHRKSHDPDNAERDGFLIHVSHHRARW